MKREDRPTEMIICTKCGHEELAMGMRVREGLSLWEMQEDDGSWTMKFDDNGTEDFFNVDEAEEVGRFLIEWASKRKQLQQKK